MLHGIWTAKHKECCCFLIDLEAKAAIIGNLPEFVVHEMAVQDHMLGLSTLGGQRQSGFLVRWSLAQREQA